MKRYNISLEYDQLVLLEVTIRRAEEANTKSCEYWHEQMKDILSRANKAIDRAHKEMGV